MNVQKKVIMYKQYEYNNNKICKLSYYALLFSEIYLSFNWHRSSLNISKKRTEKCRCNLNFVRENEIKVFDTKIEIFFN